MKQMLKRVCILAGVLALALTLALQSYADGLACRRIMELLREKTPKPETKARKVRSGTFPTAGNALPQPTLRRATRRPESKSWSCISSPTRARHTTSSMTAITEASPFNRLPRSGTRRRPTESCGELYNRQFSAAFCHSAGGVLYAVNLFL